METKLLLMFLIVLAGGLVLAVTRVLGAWTEHHISRHDLIVKSKRRRYDYLQAMYDRDRERLAAEEDEDAYDSIVIEEADEPRLAA